MCYLHLADYHNTETVTADCHFLFLSIGSPILDARITQIIALNKNINAYNILFCSTGLE